jgi:subtilisin family serine protease
MLSFPGRAAILLALFLFSLPETRAAEPAGIEARKALARDGKVRVSVTLREDATQVSSPSSKRRVRADSQENFLKALEAHAGKEVRYRYRFSASVLLEISDAAVLDAIDGLPGVARVDLDATGSGGLDETRPLIHADEVFESGITGAGRVVAVLDTGVPDDHPDLAGAVLHRHHFLDGDNGPGATDGHGHGTNVTGIIASRGTTSPRGVAPGSSIVAIKVLDDENRGFLSDWAMGVEHAVALHEDGEIRIDAINMSLVSDVVYPGPCDEASFGPLNAACQAALDAGIAIFASSGNTGSSSVMTSPACLSSAYAVGSVSDSPPDHVSSFTSRNRYLDLLAPGQSVTSLGRTFTGTSQASPHAAAVACLVREVDPTLTPPFVLGILQKTGVPVEDSASGFTFPRIDALGAVTSLTTDCNENDAPDVLDILTGVSRDCNLDGIPDECGEDLPGECLPFHRGDPNRSGELDLSDAIFVFLYLFAGGGTPTCLESADANNDGDVNITDGIAILEFLFSGGAPISSPGPPGVPCGLDPDLPGSTLSLGCDAYDRC